MHSAVPLACFLSLIRPPGVQYESALLQVAPVDKALCPYVRDSSDVAFHLYTRHNPTVYQELVLGDDERLFASHMDWAAPTVIYFHAFMEQPDDGSAVLVREAYMQRGEANVIMVDARRLEAGPWYPTAAHNTWYIGRFAALFIDYLVSRGLQLSRTHLVGHSLGAQAAGVAGAALSTGRVSRITGLDPALPLFSGLPASQRLDPTDADFVDVIHTDAGIFGYKEPIGHVDFFPNGGQSPQPGCELEVVIPEQLLLNKCAGSSAHQHTHKHVGTFRTGHGHTDERRGKRSISLHREGDDHSSQHEPIHTSTDSPTATTDAQVEEQHSQHQNDKNTTTAPGQRSKETTRVDSPTATTNAQVEGQKHQYDTNTGTNREPRNKERTHTNKIRNLNILRIPKLSRQWNKLTSSQERPSERPKKRSKRFLQLFGSNDDDSFIFRALNFLVRNRKSVVPIVSVVRDISTLVRSANGELNHVARERNSYVGVTPPEVPPLAYTLELSGESKPVAFLKRLFGITPKGDRLTIGSG